MVLFLCHRSLSAFPPSGILATATSDVFSGFAHFDGKFGNFGALLVLFGLWHAVVPLLGIHALRQRNFENTNMFGWVCSGMVLVWVALTLAALGTLPHANTLATAMANAQVGGGCVCVCVWAAWCVSSARPQCWL